MSPEVHRRTTGQEVRQDADGWGDVFVAGVGTGGALIGVGQILKEKNRVLPVSVEGVRSCGSSGTRAPSSW